uniref:Putative secreted protein n=1 Tax=Anopheles darlingi TaxID=43151 RepID=A0A2M4D8L3_ANODA
MVRLVLRLLFKIMLLLLLLLLRLFLAIGRRRSSVAVVLAIERFVLHGRHRIALTFRRQAGRTKAHSTTTSQFRFESINFP